MLKYAESNRPTSEVRKVIQANSVDSAIRELSKDYSGWTITDFFVSSSADRLGQARIPYTELSGAIVPCEKKKQKSTEDQFLMDAIISSSNTKNQTTGISV